MDKLNGDILGKFLKSHDIILLSETCTKDTDNFPMSGFVFDNYPRKFKHQEATRSSGGLDYAYEIL